MAKDIDEVACRIDAVIAANQDARRAMKESERILNRALGKLRETQSVPDTLLGMPPVSERPNVRESLKHYEEARHELRLAVIAKCLDDGMSIGEVSRRYGFSRQLASRYAKEVRERPAGTVR